MQRPAPRNLSRIIFSSVMALGLCACAAGGGSPPTSMAESVAQPEAASIESMRDHALRDLSRRLNVLSRDIRVVSAEAVSWPDGAMGCPLPGFAYTQAVVPGFHVVLAFAEREYHYHGGSIGRPLLCPEDRRQAPLPGTADSSAQ